MIQATKKEFHSHWIAFGCIFIVLLLSYSPVLLTSYAHHDDYFTWGWDHQSILSHPHLDHMIKSGRFLGGIINALYGILVNYVKDLTILRLISIFILSFCAFLCYLQTHAYFANKKSSFFLSLLLFTLPPFQILVSWASGVTTMMGILFACLAAFLTQKVPEHRHWRQLISNPYALLATVLLLFSLFTYQSAAMFYWVMTAV